MTSPRTHLSHRLKLGVASGLVSAAMLAGVGALPAATPASAAGVYITGVNYTIVSGPTPTTGIFITDPATHQMFSFTTTTAGTYTLTYVGVGGQTGNIITVSGPASASVTLTRGAKAVTQTLTTVPLSTSTASAPFLVNAFPS
jgi:hypothetical protein